MNSTEPLGLPRGSVRALLTFAILAVLCVSLFVETVPGGKSILDGLLVLAGISLRDYFSTRSEQNAADGPPLPPPATN